MNKQEMIELHQRFAQIKDELVNRGVESDRFDQYDELTVSPDRTHMSKEEHKRAIFLLGEGMADAFSDDEISDAGQLKKRMSELKQECSV